MKVLLVHNFYQSQSPSGEDIVFKNEVELLRKNGIDVVTYERFNDEIKEYGFFNKCILPFRNIWSIKTYKDLQMLIRQVKPDIVHFHNIWYVISPSAFYACKDEGIPVVQTLHNYRIACATGLLFRNGKLCEECIKNNNGKIFNKISRYRIITNVLKYRCYKNSRLLSLPIAITIYFHWIKKTWINYVNSYIALNKFCKKKFIEAGLPSNRIFIKPNFLQNPPEPNYTHKYYAVYIGRIAQEKGIRILVDSIKYYNNENSFAGKFKAINIKIVGEGPLKNEIETNIRLQGIKGVELLGRKNFSECLDILKYAKFIIIPSICYEGFPMVLREAFACGKPVIASRLGALAELVEDGKTGILFETGNAKDLAEKIKWMFENDNVCVEMGKNARKIFEEKYTAEKNFKILMDIYENTLKNATN
jgi:glycosyltransferase involved in cell wall biosynthesis